MKSQRTCCAEAPGDDDTPDNVGLGDTCEDTIGEFGLCSRCGAFYSDLTLSAHLEFCRRAFDGDAFGGKAGAK